MKLRAKYPTDFLDADNRLRRVQGPGGLDVAYTYDSSGRMLTRTSGAQVTKYEWDGWDCVRETTGSSVTLYHIPDGTLHSFSHNGVVYQCHLDALGSVRMITDPSGAVVARIEYGAFGEETFVSTIPALADFAYRFVGGLGVRTDSVTGLVYMRARWYDPSLARFISRDPIGLSGGANLYSYAGNSPVQLVDPEGLKTWKCFEIHGCEEEVDKIVAWLVDLWMTKTGRKLIEKVCSGRRKRGKNAAPSNNDFIDISFGGSQSESMATESWIKLNAADLKKKEWFLTPSGFRQLTFKEAGGWPTILLHEIGHNLTRPEGGFYGDDELYRGVLNWQRMDNSANVEDVYRLEQGLPLRLTYGGTEQPHNAIDLAGVISQGYDRFHGTGASAAAWGSWFSK